MVEQGYGEERAPARGKGKLGDGASPGTYVSGYVM
jgi:hypothetical protein